jgi:DNA repair exonuclease SbcCD nuclease subunit
MEQTVAIERDFDCDGVIWAGDVFHVKAASRNSHRLVQRVMELCKAYREPPWIVVGNHDIEHDRLDSLDKQPLGTLFASEVARPCDSQNNPHKVWGVPWQQDWSKYDPPGMKADELIVAHAPLYPVPPVHDEYYGPDLWAQHQLAGSCYYGHVHDLHGVYKVRDVWFCNQGAITRGSLHEGDLRRTVAVTIWDTSDQADSAYALPSVAQRTVEGSPFFRVELVQKSPQEVFRLSEKEALRDQEMQLDEFLQAVGTTQLGQVTVESVIAQARQDLSPQALSVLVELLDSVQ